jgi:hypothetical protein
VIATKAALMASFGLNLLRTIAIQLRCRRGSRKRDVDLARMYQEGGRAIPVSIEDRCFELLIRSNRPIA